MIALIYLLAAALCGIFALRAWTGDRNDPVRRAFMLVGILASASFLGFTLYLLPGLGGFRYLHAGAGAFLPVASLYFFDKLFGQAHGPASPVTRRLALLTPFVVLLFVAVDLTVFPHIPRASVSEVLLSIYVMGGFGLVLRRLWDVHQDSPQRVERARIRYLLFLLGAAVIFSIVEQLTRGFGPVPAPELLRSGARTFTLQGAFPPMGAVFGTLFVYFLYQVVQLYRLLDLHEIFARLFTLAVAALALVAVDGLAFSWTTGANQVHGIFQVFLASALFLALYEPLKDRIDGLAGQWFNRRGRSMELTLDEVDHALGKVISLDALEHELLGRLQGSGRAPLVTLYLLDQDRGTYRLTLRRGPSERPLMQAISPQPFTEGMRKGEPFYARADLTRRSVRSGSKGETAAARLRTLDAMNADLCLPIRSSELLLGWLNLKHESWSDGFSTEEVRHLEQTVARVSLLLENLQSFEQLKEQHRLAALGTMSAGLAHEIRNPLAGIKGAAQLLQGGATADELAQFLGIIVGEVDRLDGVVTQFLDYARTFEVRAEEAELTMLVDRVVELVRAEGLSPEVRVTVRHEDGLPTIAVDVHKVHQVVLNLIRNAIQALGDQGDVQLRVRRGRLQTGPRRGHEAQVVEVSDTGHGMSPEALEQLFVPFFTTKPGGTGLGLAICRRMVEAHGGEIAVHSRAGAGATFTVRLPASSPAAALAVQAAR